MIKTYLKIAFRNIMRYKVFSFINVIGLTIGLSASFIISLMVYYDYTFDTFHEDGDRIYRVVTDFSSPDGKFYNSGVTTALEDAIQENSNFEKVSGFFVNRPSKVENRAANIEVKWPDAVIYTDEDYFDIFQYTFLAGNKSNALSQPYSVILSEERAARYFPNQQPNDIIGKTLVYNDSLNIKVTGVVESFKQRTDFIFQEFISSPTLAGTSMRDEYLEKSWGSTNSSSQLFVKLNKMADKDNAQVQLNELALKNRDEYEIKYKQSRKFTMQPLDDVHFNPDYGIYDWSKARASKSLLQNLVLVAIFLLILGCINFINLNTATATQRSKEIGIRKTLGSSRQQLIAQFLGETFLLVCIAALLSLLLSKFLLDIFSDFIPSGLSLELFKTPTIIFSLLGLLILVTFLSGYYPALVLSKFNVVSVLKNKFVGKDKVKLRKFLTFFQFTIAQVFIIATLLVGKQINFMLTKDMGFKTEAIVSVYSPRSEGELEKKERFAQKLRSIPEIEKISLGGQPPASFSSNTSTTTYSNGVDTKQVELQAVFGDKEYAKLFDLEFLAGRDRLNDTIHELVINETASKAYGFATPQEAIGKMINRGQGMEPIVGVMADFNQRSLKTAVKPMALMGDGYRSSFTRFRAVHIEFKNSEASNLAATMNKIESAYKEVYTEVEDYRAQFMDDTVARFYNREQKVSKLLNWATGLSILISCLGLLGLVIYTTNRRVKEIGVRKVLGASLFQINSLLCKEFLVIVGIAFIVASPIAWYGIHNWLQDFAYKTSISFWVFLASGFAMILFAVLIISAKTLQVAKTDPVNSLRSE